MSRDCGLTRNEVKVFLEDALRYKEVPSKDDLIEAITGVIVENNKKIERYIKENMADIVSEKIMWDLRKKGFR